MRYALISAMILGPTCAFFGVFITLRGMSFFSDAVAHSALTGVALGFLFQEWFGLGIPTGAVVLIFSLLLASIMSYFFQKTSLSPDTVIAFSFTGSVAIGVILISKMGKYRLLDGLLFGDIYANGREDILLQLLLAAAVFCFLGWNMKALTLSIVQPDLARVQGYRMEWLNYTFSLLIAACVAVCIKMLGALLLSALIVIPAAAAKLVASNFRQMIAFSTGLGLIGAVGGVMVSYACDIPTGPTIVVSHLSLLLAALIIGRRQ